VKRFVVFKGKPGSKVGIESMFWKSFKTREQLMKGLTDLDSTVLWIWVIDSDWVHKEMWAEREPSKQGWVCFFDELEVKKNEQ